jgi:hypothetical protein
MSPKGCTAHSCAPPGMALDASGLTIVMAQRSGRRLGTWKAVPSSSTSRGRRPKTCPVLRRTVGRLVRRRAERTPKDLCGGRGRSGSDRAHPATASCPARRNGAGQRDHFGSGGEGNTVRTPAPQVRGSAWTLGNGVVSSDGFHPGTGSRNGVVAATFALDSTWSSVAQLGLRLPPAASLLDDGHGMDHPNATAYRRTADAFRAGDREALAALIDEDVVWHIPGSGPMAGDIHGHGALFPVLRSSSRCDGRDLHAEGARRPWHRRSRCRAEPHVGRQGGDPCERESGERLPLSGRSAARALVPPVGYGRLGSLTRRAYVTVSMSS